jgi:hypothetical protein
MMVHFHSMVDTSQPKQQGMAAGIRTEVIFGTPSQNCIGSGICMIMSRLPVRQPLRCPHAPAWIYFEQDQLVFRFSKSAMLREEVKSRFSTPWFLVMESFQLPRHFARQLGLPSSWVPPGLYKVTETNQDWFLTFQLKTEKDA